jgi:hypothetical protein
VLLTPSAVVILETVGLGGVFSYHKGKWKESMNMGRALRYIVEEHLGDPIRATREAEGYLTKQFEKLVPSGVVVPIKSVVVFTHPAVQLDVEAAPIPVVKVEKLRKQIATDAPRLDPDVYTQLDAFFENLTTKN